MAAATAVSSTRAFDAVEAQMKTLCLREFPCGKGNWREPEHMTFIRNSRNKGKTNAKGQDKSCLDPNSLEAIKVQAQKEKSDLLQDLVASHFSPWHLDYSWSEEAKKLREIAVKSPWLIDDKFVQSYFRTIRIINKDVTEVDENLLKLKNLEEITLSANYIKNINSKNLPCSLKVLELCANKISDLSGLCVKPPLLQHLGLGRNKISFIGEYLTGDFWPQLLSLDLSHNDLCDLMDIVSKLTTLPKLRNLLLQGNPLSLIPGYRGYTVDCLRHLSIIDDIHISADEKHHFKGLARRREFILDEARVQIGVTYIKGLPCPEEISNPENQPEYPVVERTYFVQFFFPEEQSGDKAHGAGTGEVDDLADFVVLDMEGEGAHERGQELENVKSEEHSVLLVNSDKSKSTTSHAQMERNVLFDSQPQMKSAEAKTSMASFPHGQPNLDSDVVPGPGLEGIDLALLEDVKEQEGEDGQASKCDDDTYLPSGAKLVPINTEPQPWREKLELNWTLDLTRDDLLALRDFFKQGMDFNVVEQVVLGYSMEPDENANTDKDKASDAKGGKDKKKLEAKQEKNSKKGAAKPKDAGKDKDKKKKDVELVRSPPTFTTIASFHITLDHFLEGEFDCRNIFTKGNIPSPSTIHSSDGEDKKLEKRDSRDRRKSSHDKKKEQEKKDGKKSPRGKEADKKVGKGKAHTEEAEDDDDSPPPLELEVTVKLHHWLTAMDSVEEERNKNSSTNMSTSRTQQQQQSQCK